MKLKTLLLLCVIVICFPVSGFSQVLPTGGLELTKCDTLVTCVSPGPPVWTYEYSTVGGGGVMRGFTIRNACNVIDASAPAPYRVNTYANNVIFHADESVPCGSTITGFTITAPDAINGLVEWKDPNAVHDDGGKVCGPTGPSCYTPTPKKTTMPTATPTPSCEVEKVFNLCTGLNLISLPIANSGIDTADELLASICGANEANAVWRLVYEPTRFESWTVLDPGTGWPVWTGMPFWVGVASPGCDWYLCGDMPSGIVYDLHIGINLVSRPFYTMTITMASQLLADIPGCLGVWRWRPEVTCSGPTGFDGFFPISPSFDDFPLMQGHAYWITTDIAGPWAPPNP